MFTRLKPRKSGITQLLEATVREHGLTNSFNASICLRDSESSFVCALRALPDGSAPPFRSYLIEASDGHTRVSDFSAAMASLGLPIVADPKLLKVGSDIWCTFNTGHVEGVQNKIYLVRVSPTMGSPMECLLEGRQRIEKNWAFFQQNNLWRAVYGLNPVTTLTQSIHSGDTIQFARDPNAPSPAYRHYTIGTQLCQFGDKYLLIGHRKLIIRGKRTYFGRLFSFDPITSRIDPVRGRYLIHSFRSMLGDKKRWNRNLISCTYFSGLSRLESQKQIYLSYGINDTAFSVATMREDEL